MLGWLAALSSLAFFTGFRGLLGFFACLQSLKGLVTNLLHAEERFIIHAESPSEGIIQRDDQREDEPD